MPKAVAAQFQRIETPPRTSVACVVDGEAVDVFAGDTVLTAVLTHRRNLRAFEFAEAERSGFCLMGACQDCWVHLATGEPVRACTTLIGPGMSIATRRLGVAP
jgi:predicted molibdopterin-dependent oxidoreductase YjgC